MVCPQYHSVFRARRMVRPCLVYVRTRSSHDHAALQKSGSSHSTDVGVSRHWHPDAIGWHRISSILDYLKNSGNTHMGVLLPRHLFPTHGLLLLAFRYEGKNILDLVDSSSWYFYAHLLSATLLVVSTSRYLPLEPA